MADLIVHKNSLLPVCFDGEMTFFCIVSTISPISQTRAGIVAPEMEVWSACRVGRSGFDGRAQVGSRHSPARSVNTFCATGFDTFPLRFAETSAEYQREKVRKRSMCTRGVRPIHLESACFLIPSQKGAPVGQRSRLTAFMYWSTILPIS